MVPLFSTFALFVRKKKKSLVIFFSKHIWDILLIIFLLILPLSYTTIIHEYILHVIFVFIMYGVGRGSGKLIKNRFFAQKWQKASIEELKREDSVLLEGIVFFFQTVLFIYLTLTKNILRNFYLFEMLKWSIPFITALFYILRGYGAIKDSSKHRFWSAFILAYYLQIELVSFFTYLISTYLPIYVGQHDLMSIYIQYSLLFVNIYYLGSVNNAFSARYGHKTKHFKLFNP